MARAWAAAWYFCLVVATVIVGVGHKPWWLFVLIAGMALSYHFLEYPWLLDRGDPRKGPAHLAIVSVLCMVLVYADQGLAFLVSVVLSQYSPFTGYRLRGMAQLAGVTTVLSLPVAIAGRFSGGSLAGMAIVAGTALGFNIFIGSFVGEVMSDNDRRGALIRELEATRAELERAHHEAGVRQERERLAREIHDTLAQGFTSLLMLIQAAEATLDTDPTTTRERLELAARTARENLAEARSLIGGDAAAGLPLDTALRRAAARVGEELGIAATVRISGTPRTLSANAQVVTLRVAQEALANVRKHARAGSVVVRLAYEEDGLRLAVEDDGVGMADGAACAGFGMRSMRERVAQVGGVLAIRSAVGDGTTVEAEVPYE